MGVSFLQHLPEYGVAIFAIGGMVYGLKLFASAYKELKDFAGNHIDSNTKSNERMVAAINNLIDIIKVKL